MKCDERMTNEQTRGRHWRFLRAGRALASAMAMLAVFSVVSTSLTQAADAKKRPNILVFWGDDIGYRNVSAYNQGHNGLSNTETSIA